MFAAQLENKKMIKKLLKKGANVDWDEKNQKSALIFCNNYTGTDLKYIKLLTKAGCNIEHFKGYKYEFLYSVKKEIDDKKSKEKLIQLNVIPVPNIPVKPNVETTKLSSQIFYDDEANVYTLEIPPKFIIKCVSNSITKVNRRYEIMPNKVMNRILIHEGGRIYMTVIDQHQDIEIEFFDDGTNQVDFHFPKTLHYF